MCLVGITNIQKNHVNRKHAGSKFIFNWVI